jgi:ribonuclease P protein component
MLNSSAQDSADRSAPQTPATSIPGQSSAERLPVDPAHPKPGPFPRSARLLKHASFDHVYRNGQKHFSGNMTVFFLRRTSASEATAQAVVVSGPRIGFTVPRALGGAVTRNRIKRRMREAVRRNLGRLQGPFDVVFNPKKFVAEIEFQKIESEVARAFMVVQQKAREGR